MLQTSFLALPGDVPNYLESQTFAMDSTIAFQLVSFRLVPDAEYRSLSAKPQAIFRTGDRTKHPMQTFFLDGSEDPVYIHLIGLSCQNSRTSSGIGIRP